jgi:hypothetical protein
MNSYLKLILCQLIVTYIAQRRIIIKPLSTVPFPKDPDFVGRDSIIAELDAKFSTPATHTRIALVGLGGLG